MFRYDERKKMKRGQRYGEIKGKLMSSVWICGPGVSVCVCAVIRDVNVLLFQPNPPQPVPRWLEHITTQ